MAKAKHPWHGKGKNRWKWVTLKKPPPGSYDIGLDQQVGASRRGLKDLVADIAPTGSKKIPAGTEALRSFVDTTLARQENARQTGYLGQDYLTGVGRENLGYQQTLQDLAAQTDTLKRNYAQLGNTQRQNFQAAGLAEGGAVAQAAAKRAVNQAVEQKPIDIATQRAGVTHQQSLDDMLRQQQRGAADLKSQLGQVNLTYGRGVQDRATQLTRARREANQFGRDVAAVKMQQYTSGGGRTRRKVGIKDYRKLRKQRAI